VSEPGHRAWTRGGYTVSTDPARLDLDAVHAYLARSYWSPGISRDKVERAARGSVCYGLYAPDGAQVGFARAVTDRASFAYLADVYVLEEHRGRGLGVFLAECAVGDPALAEVGRWMLRTRDAHGLYRKLGFGPIDDPELCMQRRTRRP